MGLENVKSTLNINRQLKEGLEYLVQTNEIGSFTEGVNLAIENFLKEKEKEKYAREMKLASKDNDYLKRTLGTQKEFEYSDAKIDEILVAEDLEW